MAGQVRGAAQAPLISSSTFDRSEPLNLTPQLGETKAFALGEFPQLPAGQRWEPAGDDPFERGKLMAKVVKAPDYQFGETHSFDTRFGLPGLPAGKRWGDRGADPFEGGLRMFMVVRDR
jgi:hypothetical protein